MELWGWFEIDRLTRWLRSSATTACGLTGSRCPSSSRRGVCSSSCPAGLSSAHAAAAAAVAVSSVVGASAAVGAGAPHLWHTLRRSAAVAVGEVGEVVAVVAVGVVLRYVLLLLLFVSTPPLPDIRRQQTACLRPNRLSPSSQVGSLDGGLDAAQRASRSAEDLDADLDGYMQE